MVRIRVVIGALELLSMVAVPVLAGPVSHAMELAADGTLFMVDPDRGRLLRFRDDELSVFSDLDGVPQGDHLQNLVLTVSGELYLGEKKSVWRIHGDGSVERTPPPAELRQLFKARPGDLAPDGSIYLASDFRNIDRSLPGGDVHPVLVTDTISKIHSLSVTPYGRVFFSNSAEVAKLDAEGEVRVLVELEGHDILGLAAENETSVLLLRRDRDDQKYLERVDAFGHVTVLLTGDQIASVSSDRALEIEPPQ